MVYREHRISKVYTDNKIIKEEKLVIARDMVYREHRIGKVYTDNEIIKEEKFDIPRRYDLQTASYWQRVY